jgi:hypothetical protein
MEPIFKSDRMFEVWRYSVSHRQLLLRSNKEDRWPNRIELLFKNVQFMAVPPVFMTGLEIRQCAADESALPDYLRKLPVKVPWYRLAGGSFEAYVAAGALYTHEDDLDYSDPSGLLKPPFV